MPSKRAAHGDSSRKPSIVASRILSLDGSEAKITASLFLPYRDELFDDIWTCRYAIRGAGIRVRGHARGEDSLQALFLAADAMRNELDSIENDRGVRLKWIIGDHGVPLMVPIYLSAVSRRKIAKTIQLEIHASIERAKTRSRRR